MEDVKINPEKSSTAKVIEHIPGSYSISMKLLFKWKKIIEMKKNGYTMNKSVYLGLKILEITKIVMY